MHLKVTRIQRLKLQNPAADTSAPKAKIDKKVYQLCG